MAAPDTGRYARITVSLHWLIGLLILVQIGLGWYMNKVLPDHSPAQESIETLHISLGLTTMLLIAVRIGARLAFRAPAMPPGLQSWERLLAHLTAAVFYLLMLALPLSGWVLVSMHKHAPQFWGLPWPKLPGFAGMDPAAAKSLHESVQGVHTDVLVWTLLAVLALHVAGAIKHQFDGHPVMWRIVPFLKAPR